jgi:hypothetical protein
MRFGMFYMRSGTFLCVQVRLKCVLVRFRYISRVLMRFWCVVPCNVPNVTRCQIGQQSWNIRLFSGLCLPGVEIVPIPCGSILHTTRASQL